jgi:hypothetical protein
MGFRHSHIAASHSSGGMVTSIVQEHLLGKAVFVAHYGRPK